MNLTRLTSTLLAGGALLSACLLVPLSMAWSQSKNDAATGSTATLTPQQRQKNLESFEYVWRTGSFSPHITS